MTAYFSAEWGLSSSLPIYAGGLGVLAADILKQAADENFPLVGIGLLYHEGFFQQRIDSQGNQIEKSYLIHPKEAGLEEILDPKTNQPLLIEIEFPAEPAQVKVWKKQIGPSSLYLLDANVPINEPWEREYTAQLYEGNWAPHIAQEILLGVGGVKLLRKLEININRYHINDDHAAFSILERLREELIQGEALHKAVARVKSRTVFTTHTPVAAAESKFPADFIWPYLKLLFKDCPVTKDELLALGGLGLPGRDQFSLTVLALKISGRINAVSQRHQQISKKIWHFVFPGRAQEKVPIDYVTNAVHPPTWVAQPMDKFFRKYLGPNYLGQIDKPALWQKLNNPAQINQLNSDLWQARLVCKQTLMDRANIQAPTSNIPPPTSNFPPLFLGFARRFAPYKRVYLLISDLNRLAKILTNPKKPVYLFIAGKAHPGDETGRKFLRQIFAASQDPRLKNHLILLENYDVDLAKTLISGVDVWLNTPKPPLEASGTSGMKAVFNGVLHASTADGWWWEIANLHAKGRAGKSQTSNRKSVGWVIGPANPDIENPPSDEETADALFDLLENGVVPLYYQQQNSLPLAWLNKVKISLIELAPQFNTQRLLKEYQQKLYS